MGYSTICYLCGQYIDSTRAGQGSQAWQAYFQILQQHDEHHNRLVEPSDTSIPPDTNVVHAACWVVVAKVLGSATINADWLERFYRCLQDLKPFLKSILSSHSPEVLEPNLEHESDNDEQTFQVAERGATIFGHIPIEIIQMIYSFLDCYTDIYNLQQLTNVEPDYKIWYILGQKYQDYDAHFAEGTEQNLINKFRRILENLRQRPSFFPHTLNYGTVWDNVKVVLNKLEDTLAGENFDSNILHYNAISSGSRTKSLNKKISYFDRTLGLTIRFTYVGNRRYLCGFGCDGEITGYKGDSFFQIPSAFHGLQLVSDGEGFIAIQILSQTAIPIYWPKESSETGFHSFIFGQLEWPYDQNIVTLIISLDSYKICGLSKKTEDTINLCRPTSVWQSSFPPQNLRPAVIVNHHSNSSTWPYMFFIKDLNTSIAVSAFVDLETRSISGFEFIFSSSVQRLGHIQSLAVKLSYHLDIEREEKFLWLTCADKHSHKNKGITVKIFTSLGRTIIFGDETLTTWAPGSSCKNGIFCASEIFDKYCLSVFGTFFNESDEPEQSVELLQPDISIVWETQTVKFDGYIMPTLAFLSTASLSSISKITIYTDDCSEKYLSGMKIFHTDKSPEILGEAREEYRTIRLEESLRHILIYYTINYSTCYRIQGLVFTCPSKSYKVGLCKGPLQELLEITTDLPQLYWIFDRSFSYLSLSLDDITLKVAS